MKTDQDIGVAFVDGFNAQYGAHAACRAIHAKGIFAAGAFTPNGAAARYTIARHLGGDPSPVICRFSNGEGLPDAADGLAFSLGFAVSFEQEGQPPVDLLCVDASEFVTGDPNAFLGFVRSNATDEDGKVSTVRAAAWALAHPKVTGAALRKNKAPIAASFATQQWWAIHAFWLVDAQGDQTPAKFSWRPVAPARSVDREAAKALPPDYLIEDLRERLAGTGQVEFDLVLTIGRQTDVLDDAAEAWPEDRPEVAVGRLALDRVVTDADPRRFIPNRVGDGIRCTADPLLQARVQTYAESFRRRCPHRG